MCRKAAACTCRAGYGGRPGRRGAATTSRTEAGRRGQRHPQTGGRVPGSGPASDEGFAAADLRLIAGAVPRPAQSRPQPPPPGRGAAPAPAMSAGLGCLPPTPQFSPVSQRASPAPTPWAGLLAVWRPHMGNEDRDGGDAQGSPARGWGSPCFRKAVLEAAAVHAARGQASIPAVSPASTPSLVGGRERWNPGCHPPKPAVHSQTPLQRPCGSFKLRKSKSCISVTQPVASKRCDGNSSGVLFRSSK